MTSDLTVHPDDIRAASGRIAPHVRRTPVIDLGTALSDDHLLAMKLEHLQVTGSFKARGAFSLLTSVEVTAAGVVAASGGNFGVAVAHAGAVLGHDVTVFVPETSPTEKIDRIRDEGADVRIVAGFYDEARRASEEHAAETGAFPAHPFDQHEVVAGQGTLGLELEDQADSDVVLTAVGGGGLIAGVASWFRGRAVVVAVEPALCPTLHESLAAGHPVQVDVGGSAVSSLGAQRVGDHTWAARGWIHESVLVSEEAIGEAQSWVWSETRQVIEPAAATTIAALRSGAYRPPHGSRVTAIISGGNVDPVSVATA